MGSGVGPVYKDLSAKERTEAIAAEQEKFAKMKKALDYSLLKDSNAYILVYKRLIQQADTRLADIDKQITDLSYTGMRYGKGGSESHLIPGASPYDSITEEEQKQIDDLNTWRDNIVKLKTNYESKVKSAETNGIPQYLTRDEQNMILGLETTPFKTWVQIGGSQKLGTAQWKLLDSNSEETLYTDEEKRFGRNIPLMKTTIVEKSIKDEVDESSASKTETEKDAKISVNKFISTFAKTTDTNAETKPTVTTEEVKVPTGEWVSSTDYNSLTEDEKNKLNEIGIVAFNRETGKNISDMSLQEQQRNAARDYLWNLFNRQQNLKEENQNISLDERRQRFWDFMGESYYTDKIKYVQDFYGIANPSTPVVTEEEEKFQKDLAALRIGLGGGQTNLSVSSSSTNTTEAKGWAEGIRDAIPYMTIPIASDRDYIDNMTRDIEQGLRSWVATPNQFNHRPWVLSDKFGKIMSGDLSGMIGQDSSIAPGLGTKTFDIRPWDKQKDLSSVADSGEIFNSRPWIKQHKVKKTGKGKMRGKNISC